MARKQIEELLEDQEWGRFFVMSCEYGPDRLRAWARRWCDELRVRGHNFPETEIRDALLDLAAELLPDSPAGSEEAQYEARHELLREVMYWAGHNGVPLELDADEVQEAWEGTLGGFREALREWARSGLRRIA